MIDALDVTRQIVGIEKRVDRIGAAGPGGVPLNGIIMFDTVAQVTAAGPDWTVYAAMAGRMPIGAGATFSQTFTEATDFGAAWTHAHGGTGLIVTLGGTTSTPSGANATETFKVPAAGTDTTVADQSHTHTPTGLTATPGGTTATATWLPPMRCVVFAKRV